VSLFLLQVASIVLWRMSSRFSHNRIVILGQLRS